MTSKLAVLCDACQNLRPDGLSCPAYPGRIPERIRVWAGDHRQVAPDQAGDTVFELGQEPQQQEVFEAWKLAFTL